MIFTGKDSLFIAGLTAALVLSSTPASHAARPPEQGGFSSTTDKIYESEDLGYDALLRYQLLTILETGARDRLSGDAVPPPVPQKLLVFFETQKAELQPDAKLIVQEAAAEAQRDRPNTITVLQVADPNGRNATPMLAKERAQVVRDELVRLGVPMEQITVQRKPAPTAPGRKVEIVYE